MSSFPGMMSGAEQMLKKYQINDDYPALRGLKKKKKKKMDM